MSLRINTNITSLKTQQHLKKTQNDIQRSMEKLSSGHRINTTSDDIGGQMISEQLKAEIKGLNQIERNATDGISLIQIAEGGLSELSNLLVRLKELTVQAASDTMNDQDRQLIQIEYKELLSEIDRISKVTAFNNIFPLNGSRDNLNIQIGTGNDPLIDRLTFNTSLTNVTVKNLLLDTISIVDKRSSQNSLNKLDGALTKISTVRSHFGALHSRLRSILHNIQFNIENLSTSRSLLKDTDIASETAEMTKKNILLQAGMSILTQANSTPKIALNLIQRNYSR